MWQAHNERIPASLSQAIGMGREPVFSHADQAWYMKAGPQVVRWGLAAPAPRMAPIQRTYGLTGIDSQIPGLGADPTNPADGSTTPSPTSDATLLAAAQAVAALSNPCDYASASTVTAFQNAWNNSSDSASRLVESSHGGWQIRFVDGGRRRRSDWRNGSERVHRLHELPCNGHHVIDQDDDDSVGEYDDDDRNDVIGYDYPRTGHWRRRTSRVAPSDAHRGSSWFAWPHRLGGVQKKSSHPSSRASLM